MSKFKQRLKTAQGSNGGARVKVQKVAHARSETNVGTGAHAARI